MKTLIFIALMVMSMPAWAIDVVYLTVDRADGSGMTVIVGNSKTKLIKRGALPADATDEDYVNYIRNGREECAVAECVQMPDGWFPPFDRRLRNAWKKGANKNAHGNFNDVDGPVRGIDIDMPKARKIWGEKIQQAAVDELRRETIDVRVAEVQGNTRDLEALKAKRDRLFGIMEGVNLNLEAAQTPEELMAIWPAEIDPKLKPELPSQAKVDEIKAEQRKLGRKD